MFKDLKEIMAQHEIIKLFEENKMRIFFDDIEEQWYFCINDVVQALTDSVDPADYFKKMRRRDAELNDFVTGTNCPPHQFASTDGKILENENRPQVVDDSIEAIRPQIVDRLLNDLFSVPWGHHKYMANDTTVE